jgi:mannose-1-phosphate guanylyltransferase/mannose-6-phosphate isomerase
MTKIVPVVMAGGSGTRLWPLSRKMFPKQFLSLVNSTTMFQDTLSRLQGNEFSVGLPIIVCNDEHRFIVAEQLRETSITSQAIILEPVGRNTAPAVALAALDAIEKGDDPLLLVLAADHVIRDDETFRKAVVKASTAAQAGKLVTFGIVPRGPETGYGYIKAKASTEQLASVETFVEKPDLETAKAYLASGDYFWNSGMFLFKASSYLAELKRHQPAILGAVEKAYAGKQADLDFTRLDVEAFKACPDDSIDYAVMEKNRQCRHDWFRCRLE